MQTSTVYFNKLFNDRRTRPITGGMLPFLKSKCIRTIYVDWDTYRSTRPVPGKYQPLYSSLLGRGKRVLKSALPMHLLKCWHLWTAPNTSLKMYREKSYRYHTRLIIIFSSCTRSYEFPVKIRLIFWLFFNFIPFLIFIFLILVDVEWTKTQL